MTKKQYIRAKPIPEEKQELVKDLAGKMKNKKTILIASMRGLPGGQFNQIKKNFRGKADVKVAKKSIVFRAIDETGKGALQELKKELKADFVLFFSDLDAFELSGMLSDNVSPARAKAGDISPEDIEIEAGMTELLPGPAISELGSVGLKVKVTDGKLEIMQGAVVVKEGEPIKENVASVLGKLGIEPMRVGFTPLAAYDSESDKVYVDIKIDKPAVLEELRSLITKAMGFAINVEYPCDKTIGYFIARAGREEKALEALSGKSAESEEKVEKGKDEGDGEKVEDKPGEPEADTKEDEKTKEEKVEGEKSEEPEKDNNENAEVKKDE